MAVTQTLIALNRMETKSKGTRELVTKDQILLAGLLPPGVSFIKHYFPCVCLACYHNGVRYQFEDTWEARDCLKCTCSSAGVQCCKT